MQRGDQSIRPLDYHVIASGSSGNAVRIETIMIDCGIPFSKIKDDLYRCDTLLITHAHCDHIKANTYHKIREVFPKIKVYANADVAYQFDVDTVIGSHPFRLPRRRVITPFYGTHDIPVTGYLIEMLGYNILYATDTNTIKNPKDLPLDYIFLESNYDERKLREFAHQYASKGYDPMNSSFRHLSTQKCKEFYYVNRRSKDSVLIELHKSQRFY